MRLRLRLAILRLLALAGVGFSAVLVADAAHPGRTFCPLEKACEKARESALGQIGDIPTSRIGLAAFVATFALTLLPMGLARWLLRPAGLVAAVCGATFIAYQFLVLGSFCPLCLGADTAGVVFGLVAFGWPKPGPSYRGESGGSRFAWAALTAAVVAAPFWWPRTEDKGWEEIADTTLAEEDGWQALTPTTGNETVEPTPVAATAPSIGSPAPSAMPAVLVSPSAPRARPTVTIVEYLNAYCAHCRATHRRLDKVLEEMGVTARRHRVYTWAGNEDPLWAKAVAYAESVGREDAMFLALMDAQGQGAADVLAAARRAGLDVKAVQAALRDATPAPRLVHDRRAAQATALRGLPTIDIGRRRLMGEQTEDELREAVKAALSSSPARR